MKSHNTLLAGASIAIPVILESGILIYHVGKHLQEKSRSKSFKEIGTEVYQNIKKHSIETLNIMKRNPKRTAAVLIAAVLVIYLIQTSASAYALQWSYNMAKNCTPVKQGLQLYQNILANPWNSPIKPPDTKGWVYSGHLLMGAQSFVQAHRSWKSGEKCRSLMHLFIGVTSCVVPIKMEITGEHVRWHHLSYGILTTLPGFRALSLFGIAMTADGLSYWMMKNPSNYGFDNIFVENLGKILTVLAVSTVWESLFSKLKLQIAASTEKQSETV